MTAITKKIISTLHIITLCGVLLILSSCNSNNGDIGPWYGHWKLTEIRINGEVDTQYEGNIFWAFQNSVVQMTQIHTTVDYDSRWGSWSQTGDELTLDFGHHDNLSESDPSTAWRYSPPAATHLEAGINKLHIDKLSSSNIQLTYSAPDGNVYTYYLKAWE